VEDALAVTAEVLRRVSSYGAGPVAVAGDSAGGNLSAVVAQRLPVDAQFLIYPAVDMAGDYPSRAENGEGYFLDLPTMTYFVGHYLADEVDLSDPRLSPINGVRAGLPPAVVLTAQYDPLRDEGMAYADALEQAGVPVVAKTYPGMIHGFFDMGVWSVAAQAAVDDAIGLFAELLESRQ
jgi:acetyl esterase